MISIREQSYGLNVALYNEFTLDDFRQLEEALLAAKQKVHLPDILLDLSMLKDFTIDMAVEQIKFLKGHIRGQINGGKPAFFLLVFSKSNLAFYGFNLDHANWLLISEL